MTEEGRRRSGNGLLVGILLVLVVAIVGLAVGIVMVNLQREENSPEIVVKDDEIVNEILNTIRPMSIDESEEYLDGKLEEYKGTSLEFDIEMMKINVYVNGGRPADAIAVAAIVNDGKLDDEEKMQYYMALNKAYRAIGDNENANYYRDKYFVIYDEIYDGGGGGE